MILKRGREDEERHRVFGDHDKSGAASGPGASPKDGIYTAILWLMVVNVMLGAGLALLGDLVWRDAAVSAFGVGLAVVAGTVYWVFRWLGRREARRRAGKLPAAEERD